MKNRLSRFFQMRFPKYPQSQISALLPLLLTAIVFYPMLKIGFINDDVENILFAMKGWDTDFSGLFSKQELMVAYFRPLVSGSFSVDYVVWGWNPVGFRLTNLLLHLINTLLVFSVAKELSGSDRIGLLASLLFGVLPIHELSILWLPGRTDLICSMFYLGSIRLFLAYQKEMRVGMLTLSLISFAAALLSKEMAFSLPLTVLLLSWWRDRRTNTAFDVKSALCKSLPFIGIALLVLGLRWYFLDNNVLMSEEGLHTNRSVIQMIKNLASYFGLLIIPVGHFAIEQMLSRFPLFYLGIAIVGAIGAAVIAWKFGRSAPVLLLSLLWILLTLLPVSRLMMRWYLYIPSVGFCLLLGWAGEKIWAGNWKRGIVLVSVLWIGYAAILFSSQQNWIRASELGDKLLAEVETIFEKADGVSERITFITVPSKIGGTPVFHRGIASALALKLRLESVSVTTWARVVMDEYPSRIEWEFTDGQNEVILRAKMGACFLFDFDDLNSKRIPPTLGLKFSTDDAEVTILSLNENNKPIEVKINPHKPIALNFFVFDGEKFQRIQR